MTGSPAAAALLLLLYTTDGAFMPSSSPTKQLLQGNRRIGRALRGRLQNTDVGASRNMLYGISAIGHLALLEKCYMTDDCAPGLFMEADFRTQCETTPFFTHEAVCCKPFATPCDSNEACCSGTCNTKYTRCDDVDTTERKRRRVIPSERRKNGNQNYDDAQEGDRQYDDSQYDDDQIDDGQYGDGQYDDGQYDDGPVDDGQYDDSQYDDGQHDDGQNDGGEYDDVQFDDVQFDGTYADGQRDNGQYDDGRYDDGQYDDGQYEDGQHDDAQYDDGKPDDGIMTDNTAANSVPASTGPVAGPIPDISSPNSADSPDNAEDDNDGPPMKIDPDGPYARGRSYSDYDDDHYHGYSRGEGDKESKIGQTQPAPQEQQSEGGGNEGTPVEPDGDVAAPTPADEDDTLPGCVTDYSSGTIETIATSSEERIEVVAMDSQGNIFYTLSYGHGTADTIRRATPPSTTPASNAATGVLTPGEDVLVYTGTGVILAMAVDAEDNVVFSMEDAPAVSGGVYLLKTAPGGELLPQDGGGGEASFGDAAAPAVLLTGGLGPFLPGVAVCPLSGDVYVSRGHTGIARLVKDADGGFGTKVEWDMKDMTFDDMGTARAPLEIWDIAVDSHGIVYVTTYVQGVVLKAIFPKSGGSAQVRLAAGSWNSGVTASSGDGGKAVSAVIAYPKGIAIDGDDVLYVAEFQGQKIRKVSTAGVISTVAGTGSTVNEGDGGPASEAGLDLPNAIAFAPGKSGSKMAIADFGHSAVRVVAPVSLCA